MGNRLHTGKANLLAACRKSRHKLAGADHAAKSAAQAAWWLGIVSSVIGAFTLAAAFAAARWAKKAAVETERTADAARDALAHQIETSNKQLRAYVSIGRPTVKKIKAETWIVTFPILNTGQTPATDVRGSLASSFEPYPVSRAAIQNLKMTERQVANIGPHAERYRYFQHDLDETLVELLNSGQMCFVYCVKISYTVFTGERIDDVCHWWIVRGPEMAHGAPSVLDDQHYCD